MYDRPPVVALRDLLALVAAEHPRARQPLQHAELRRRVHAAVDDFKAAGWPPERAIVAVKQVAFDVGMAPSRGVVGREPLTEQDAAIVDMVRWTIERYYDVSIVRM